MERMIKEHCCGPVLNSSRRSGNLRHRSRAENNCEVCWQNYFIDEDGILRIPIVALRDIAKSEKLTYDYPFNSGHHESFVFESSCSESETDSDSVFGQVCSKL